MGKLAEHWVEIGARIEGFNKGMSRVERATVQIGKGLEKAGKKMSRYITLPILAAGVAAIKMGADFDKAMTESLAIMGDVSDAMRKKMANAALEMSTKTTFAAKELAEAYFFLASAGMNAAQSIKALPVVAKFAQAGAFDLATATDLLTDAQTALGLSSKDAIENQKNLIKVSDVLVKANTLANASVQQFSESLTNRAAAALVNVNKSMEEGVAVLAAYADKGVKGQVAGMRLAMMLNSLDVAARKNKDAWKNNGIALFDARGEMRGMGDIIGDLEGLLGDMTTEQRSATLAQLGFNVRTKASILTLMGSSEKIKQWTKDLKEAGGTTETVAEKQMKAFSNQMTVLKNIFVKVGIQLGDVLIPIVKDLVDNYMTPTIEKLSKLSEGTKKLTVKIVGLVAVMGPLLIIFGKFLQFLPAMKVGILALAGPIGIVIAAIAALGVWTNHVINLHKKRTDAEISAIIKSSNVHAQYHALRKKLIKKKLIKDEILTVEEWKEIFNKHGRSYARVMRAISTLPEYAHIRKKWEEMKGQQEKAGEATDDLGRAFEKLLGNIDKNSDEIATLIKTMTDEIMQATLTEYEYRIWAAKQTYEERKQLLKDEEADKEAFVLAEKAYAEELKGIERERTDNTKEQYRARGMAIYAYFEMVKEKYEKFQEYIAKYTAIVQKHTLSEFDYRKAMLDARYEKETKAMEDDLGATEAFYEAKLELDKAYNAELAQLLEDRKKNWLNNLFTIADAVANLFYQIGMLADTNYQNQINKIDAEYDARKKAIDDSMIDDEEKYFATEKLEREMAAKKKAIQKKAFESQKKISLVTAAINVAEAITKALTGAIPPWNFILAGLAAAAGAVQIATISAQTFPGLKEGGLIPRPMPVMAGHGPRGEIIAQPSKLAEIISREMPRIASPEPAFAPATIQPIVNIYAQRLDRDTVDRAGEEIMRAVNRAKNRGL